MALVLYVFSESWVGPSLDLLVACTRFWHCELKPLTHAFLSLAPPSGGTFGATGLRERSLTVSGIALSLDLQPRNTVSERWTSDDSFLHSFMLSIPSMPDSKLGVVAQGRRSLCLHRISDVNRDERY